MYPNDRILVETDWLAENLGDPNLRLFDVTGMLTAEFVNLAKTRSYNAGHIPGAAFLNVAGRDGALAEEGAEFPWTWPSAEAPRGSPLLSRPPLGFTGRRPPSSVSPSASSLAWSPGAQSRSSW